MERLTCGSACRSARGAPPWSRQQQGTAARASRRRNCSIQCPEERGIAQLRAGQDMRRSAAAGSCRTRSPPVAICRAIILRGQGCSLPACWPAQHAKRRQQCACPQSASQRGRPRRTPTSLDILGIKNLHTTKLHAIAVRQCLAREKHRHGAAWLSPALTFDVPHCQPCPSWRHGAWRQPSMLASFQAKTCVARCCLTRARCALCQLPGGHPHARRCAPESERALRMPLR